MWSSSLALQRCNAFYHVSWHPRLKRDDRNRTFVWKRQMCSPKLINILREIEIHISCNEKPLRTIHNMTTIAVPYICQSQTKLRSFSHKRTRSLSLDDWFQLWFYISINPSKHWNDGRWRPYVAPWHKDGCFSKSTNMSKSVRINAFCRLFAIWTALRLIYTLSCIYT